jgi:hypothetical protein
MYPHPHDALPLPPKPSLEQYKKRAKDLLKAARSPDPTAIHTWAAHWIESLLRLAVHRTESSQPSVGNSVSARRSRAATQSKDLLPAGSSKSPKGNPLNWLIPDHRTAQLETFAREKLSEAPALTAAQFVIARAHGFESWPQLAKHIESLARVNSTVDHFERAVDAIVAGEKNTLADLLKKYPDLVRARSTRRHQATLLHYVAGNGVEDYRQKTPTCIVEIAQLLLDSGAEVNAVADLYGGSTTLSLVATSVHPERAGLQLHLLQLLFDHGTSIDAANSPALLVNVCLANGRRIAAEFLAGHGAKLDLEAAAGLGRLDLVRNFFDESGAAWATATKEQKEQMERALLWACEYGHDGVVNFLLDRGVPIQSQANTGQTPLHWAVIGAQTFTITLLLSRGADLEAKNAYGGTPLGQALWSAGHSDSIIDYQRIADLLKLHGAKRE